MRGVFFFRFLVVWPTVLYLLVINLAKKKKENSKTKIVQLVNRSQHSFKRKNYCSNTNLKGPVKLDRTSSSSRILRDRRWSSWTIK